MEGLEAEFERGKAFLGRLELGDAEEIFRDILQRVPADGDPLTHRIIAGSLLGLAEIHAKHCRRSSITHLDWTCGMLFALLFYRTTAETCEKFVRQRSDEKSNSTGSGGDGGLADTAAWAKSQATAVESNLLAALRGKIFENSVPVFGSFSFRRGRTSTFDDAWFEGLWDFCCRSAEEYQSDGTGNDVIDDAESQVNGSGVVVGASDDDHDDRRGGTRRKRRFSLVARDPGAEMTVLPRPPEPCVASTDNRPISPTASTVRNGPVIKKRINFDKFQDAIKQFVGDVSKDIRSKYSCISGIIPHGLLEQRVCSELAFRLSPGSGETQDLQTIFENLLTEEEEDEDDSTAEEPVEDDFQESSSEDEVDDPSVETFDLFVKPSAVHSREEKEGVSDPPRNDLVLYGNGQNSSNALAIVNATQAKGTTSNGNMKPTKQSANSSNGTKAVETKKNYRNRSIESLRNCSGDGSGVLTKWRRGENDKSIDDHYFSSTFCCGFEEVSPFSEKRERSGSATGSVSGLHQYINESRLSQHLAVTAMKLADALKKETHSLEAIHLYKFAYGILRAHPLSTGQQHEEMMAGLLVDIGSTCCGVGEMESGSELMRRAATLYEASGELRKQANVWYQLGNAHLSDGLRQESILAKAMHMIKDEVKREEEDEEENEDGTSEESSDEGDTYCTCIYDAIDCYKLAVEAMDRADAAGRGRDPDLLANVLTNLADCQMMTGSLDQAEHSYEAALRLFSNTFGNALLQKNSHVLGMVGTLTFLTRNYVRSATMFETSHVLRQHIPDTEESTLEIAWNLTMLAMSYHFLGHHHQAVTWCIRAFNLYTRFFRGRLLTVDSLSRWFVVQNLFVLGFAYNSLRLHKKALHYLNFCKNMIVDASDDQDPDQSAQVYLALGDAHLAEEDKANADRCYDEARKRIDLIDDGTWAKVILEREVECRLGGGGSVSTGVKGRDQRVHHEGAVCHQRDVESSIKESMVSILLRLGFSTRSDEKDIDRAIGCYDECVQGYRDLGEPTEAARALATVGTLCQVKSRVHDEDSRRKQFTSKAEGYFSEAYSLTDSTSVVWVQYGNFLYGEGRYLEALQLLLPFSFCERPGSLELSYSGIEQMALPVHLHQSIEEDEVMVVEVRVLAKFLALLCFRHTGMTRDADDALDELYRTVAGSTRASNYTLLGYALLECQLFRESAEAFMWASRLQPESDLSYFVAWVTLLLSAYAVMAQGLDRLLRTALASEGNRSGAWTFDEKKSYIRQQISRRRRRSRKSAQGQEEEKMNSDLHVQQNGEFSSRTPVQNHRQDNLLVTHSNINHEDGSLQNLVTPPGQQSPVVRRNFMTNGPPSGSQLRPLEGQESSGQEESNRGTKKKWRSRLYHNLPDA